MVDLPAGGAPSSLADQYPTPCCRRWSSTCTWLPALPELRTILDKAERSAPTIVTSAYGRPLTEAGLRKAFRTLVLRLERDQMIAAGLTLHGRRHTLGDELANLGADPRMIQAVLRHRSMAASLHYSAGADRRRAASAAVELLKTRRRE